MRVKINGKAEDIEEKTILDIVEGRSKQYYTVSKFASFFKLPVDLFLSSPENFLEGLRGYCSIGHNERVSKEGIKRTVKDAKIRERTKTERERQLSFNF